MTNRHKHDHHEHDRNVRSAQVQLLVVGVILLVIACVLLGMYVSDHWTHQANHTRNPSVNVRVSQSCVVNNPPGIPIVNGKG